MPSAQDLTNALRAADAAGDTAGAQRIAALLKDQAAAPQNPNNAIAGEPDLGSDAANSALAAGLHFVHQLPFVGDAALTGARLLANQSNGEGGNWQQANQDVHTMLDSAQQGHPVTSTLGGVAGGADAAIVGGGALKAAGVPAALTTLQGGQPLLNGARLALAGATAGAAQGGGEQAAAGNSPLDILKAGSSGALMGAAMGPLAGAVAGAGGALFKRFAPGLAGKTAQALAKVFGESPTDLQAAWSEHVNATGRPPTMAELTNYKQLGAIKGLAKDSTTIADRLQQNAQDAALQRSTNMQAGFEQAGSASPSELSNVRTQQGDLDYPASRAAPDFSVSTQPDAALGGVSPADHLAGEILPQAGLGRADRVRILNGLQNGTLTGQDAQMIRSGLSTSLNRNYSPALQGYVTDLDSFLHAPGNAASAAPLDQATANFAANSQRVEGAQHGAGILSAAPGDFAATAAAKPNANPNFSQGMHLGANDALSNAAATPQGATSLAGRLATDNGLYDKLSTTFGQGTADALRRMGTAEASAATAVAPFSSAPAAEQNDSPLKDAAQVGMALASHGLGWKMIHAAKAITGLSMPPQVQETVSRYLTDPKMAPAGINLLSRAGATNAQIRQMAMTAAAGLGVQDGDGAAKSMRPYDDGGGVTIEDVHPATAAELAAARQ